MYICTQYVSIQKSTLQLKLQNYFWYCRLHLSKATLVSHFRLVWEAPAQNTRSFVRPIVLPPEIADSMTLLLVAFATFGESEIRVQTLFFVDNLTEVSSFEIRGSRAAAYEV